MFSKLVSKFRKEFVELPDDFSLLEEKLSKGESVNFKVKSKIHLPKLYLEGKSSFVENDSFVVAELFNIPYKFRFTYNLDIKQSSYIYNARGEVITLNDEIFLNVKEYTIDISILFR